MDMMEQLSRIGIVPVIAINDAADAVPLAQALIDGGLPCAEVTFRTAAAADAIKNMTEAFPAPAPCSPASRWIVPWPRARSSSFLRA